MNYIIIRFRLGDKIITWVFTEIAWMRYMGYADIILGIFAVLVYRTYQKKKLQKLNLNRGGLNIEEYLDPDLTYEVQNKDLAKVIRDFVNKHLSHLIRNNVPLIIDGKLAIIIVHYAAKQLVLATQAQFIIEQVPVKALPPIFKLLNEYDFFGMVSLGPTMDLRRFILLTGLPVSGTMTVFGAGLFLVPAALNILGINAALGGGIDISLAVIIAISAVNHKGTTDFMQRRLDFADRQTWVRLFKPIKSCPTESLVNGEL